MKISALLAQKRPTLSLEVFPPKDSDHFDSIKGATEEIAALHPDFMSVTCRGNDTNANHFTVEIAENLQNRFGVTSVAHITCVDSTRAVVADKLAAIRAAGIENVLALRGDIPAGSDPAAWEYHHAAELVREIKAQGDFCVGGACYPEGHPESPNVREDIVRLKEKVDAGCDFLTTQMFYDNNILYNFLYKIREAGITVPVIAGIMPVTNANSLKRIYTLSGNQVPQRFRQIVDRFGDDPAAMKQAGIAYATDQVIDLLANGVNAVHIYTMNKPDVAAKIQANLSEILK